MIQVGRHNEKRVSYGHSMIIDPWGIVLADLGDIGGEPEIATAEIDYELLKKIRREMPLARRTYVLRRKPLSCVHLANYILIVTCTQKSELPALFENVNKGVSLRIYLPPEPVATHFHACV